MGISSQLNKFTKNWFGSGLILLIHLGWFCTEFVDFEPLPVLCDIALVQLIAIQLIFYVQIKILRAHEIALACSKRPDSPPTLLIRIDPIFKRNGTVLTDFSISIWLCVLRAGEEKKFWHANGKHIS